MATNQPTKLTLAALVPALNEAATIERVVDEVATYVDVVLVVDDGSTDRTAQLAEARGAIVIRHGANSGKGAALRTGLAWARGRRDLDAIVLIDGDGQHDPHEIRVLAEQLIIRDLDIVVGSRFIGSSNVPAYRLFGLHVLSAAAALGSGVRLTDSQSGYRILSRRAVDEMHLTRVGFAVESEMQFEAAKHNLRIAENAIRIRYDGPARRSPIVHGLSVLLATIRMTAVRRPARIPLLLATPIAAMRIHRAARRQRG